VRYVFVDGVLIGKAPQEYHVSPGRHEVVVTSEQHGVPVQRISQSVQVTAGGYHRVEER